jgi:hypothetical protein
MGTGSTTLATTTARTAVALAFVVDVHAVFAAVAASLLRTTSSGSGRWRRDCMCGI